jgi:hypothetical protein
METVVKIPTDVVNKIYWGNQIRVYRTPAGGLHFVLGFVYQEDMLKYGLANPTAPFRPLAEWSLVSAWAVHEERAPKRLQTQWEGNQTYGTVYEGMPMQLLIHSGEKSRCYLAVIAPEIQSCLLIRVQNEKEPWTP